jgi:fructuronate reductase/mannitol 2-dehydrogenase
MPGNGAIARAAVLSIAAQRDDRLTTWIEEHVTFPSSMVDRITPGTTDADRRMVAKTFGVRDQWPVMTEPFSQWVIEDEFCNGRPPLDDVGVQFVSDVRPYALMKTRLLNASHSALGYLGSLAGHECTDELMRDPVFAAYTRQLMEDEISPLLPAVTTNLPTYCATVRKRLANRAIADRLRRLCRNGSAKVPAHLLSSIAEAREAGRPHELLTLAVAGWCQYLREIAPAELDDPQGARLQALARASAKDPRPLLADAATFGALGRCARFGAAVQRDMRDLAARGATAVVADRALQPLRAAS